MSGAIDILQGLPDRYCPTSRVIIPLFDAAINCNAFDAARLVTRITTLYEIHGHDLFSDWDRFWFIVDALYKTNSSAKKPLIDCFQRALIADESEDNILLAKFCNKTGLNTWEMQLSTPLSILGRHKQDLPRWIKIVSSFNLAGKLDSPSKAA